MATNPVRRIRGTGPLTPEEVARERAIRREVYAEFPSLRMTRYRDLASKLALMRRGKEGYASSEQDAVLEEMERVWNKLTVEERDVLNQDSPKLRVPRGVASKTT
jgi:hypothetical protein